MNPDKIADGVKYVPVVGDPGVKISIPIPEWTDKKITEIQHLNGKCMVTECCKDPI